MRFAEPIWLWLLLLLPALALGGAWAAARRRQRLERFAGGRKLVGQFTGEVSMHRRAAKLLLVHLVLAGVTLALARPQWGTRSEPVIRHGADVVLVVDTSLSMAAEDLAPGRLRWAQHAAASLTRQLQGDRVALVTFAGEATLACPLTIDGGAIRLFLEALDVQSVSVPGTALARALELAERTLGGGEASAGERGRAVVLFSDGEDHEGGLDDALARLHRAGVVVHAVGCGTTRGAPIPLRDASGQLTEYKKDREAKVVTTRLDESLLQHVALETEGRYYRATSTEMEVTEIVRALSGLQAGELGAVQRTRYEERFQLPLLVGWIALVAEGLLGDRRRIVERAAVNKAEAA